MSREPLAETQRELLDLIAAGAVDYEELAELLGVSENTVKTRVQRLRWKFQARVALEDLPGVARGLGVWEPRVAGDDGMV